MTFLAADTRSAAAAESRHAQTHAEKGWTWMGPKRSLFFLQLVETAQDLLRIPVLRQQADRMSGAPQE